MKLRSVFIKLAMVCACLAAGMSSRVSAETADYVFTNGVIYTIDSQNPKAQAIAISGKQISYVGSDAAAQAFVGDKTKVVDLRGQML